MRLFDDTQESVNYPDTRAMSESPKRRKVKQPPVPSKKKVKMQVVWPENELPCEIYDLIVCYLDRADIQNMRLVNHEFEQKVSEYLFKRVVVPFKPELYSISEPSQFPQCSSEDATTNTSTSPHGAVLLQDKGMRVFQGFGSHIRQFALSFEFDEALLSRPPIKTDQEAVTTFWGIYRWPFKEYNRYRQLEGLEQTADETRTMANALRYITKANELGLSIDGGLGWLSGPDSREKPARKPSVFGGPRYFSDGQSKRQHKSLITPNTSFSSDFFDEDPSPRESAREALLERMLRESGYEGSALTRSLRTLAESEGPATINPMLLDSTLDSDPVRNSSIEGALRASGYTGVTAFHNMRAALINRQQEHPLNARWDLTRTPSHEIPGTSVTSRSGPSSSASALSDNNGVPLKPNDLTNAQKEMLLEIEWAQRAFMQSWAIAIIDNVDTFHGIETLTIARLPSRHLPIIKREDFWNSFPSLRKLSLAVIPDWRELVKLATSFVQDVRLDPSRAATTVYELIKHHIAPRENIKFLHFEWICGGEDASGLFARNRHVLAAPIISKSLDMVNMVNQPTILSLPHVEHLSIKNCWFSPHVLMRFADAHRDSLLSLTLNSVSLCAPLTRNAQPGPIHHPAGGHHGVPALFGGMQAAMAGNVWLNPVANHFPNQAAVPAVPVAPAPPTASSWRSDPREESWAHIIDNLTPGDTVAIKRFDPNRDFELPPIRQRQKLKKIEFKSCGYLYLPLDYDQSILQAANPPLNPDSVATHRRRGDIDSHMMKSADHSLGQIINHIDPDEVEKLEHVFNLHTGWLEDDDGRARIVAAEADGVVDPGQGRFTGIVEADPLN